MCSELYIFSVSAYAVNYIVSIHWNINLLIFDTTYVIGKVVKNYIMFGSVYTVKFSVITVVF